MSPATVGVVPCMNLMLEPAAAALLKFESRNRSDIEADVPVISSAAPGVDVPMPTFPPMNETVLFESIAIAVTLDVANVVGDDVAMYRLPLIERKFHGFCVSEASDNVSWPVVDVEMVRSPVGEGVVVPIPNPPAPARVAYVTVPTWKLI